MKKKGKRTYDCSYARFGSAGTRKQGAVTQNGSKRVPVVRKRGAGGQNGVLVVQEGLLGVETRGWGFEDGWWGVETYSEGLKEGAGGLKRVLRGSKGVLVG